MSDDAMERPEETKGVEWRESSLNKPLGTNGASARKLSLLILPLCLFYYLAATRTTLAREELQTMRTRIKQEPLIDTLSCEQNNRIPKQWCLDFSGTPRYVGNTTVQSSIQRYNHQGFEKCLANKTVVFIGDSRVRYQFMHLIGFLRRKCFMKCQDYDPFGNSSTLDDDCYLIEREYLFGVNDMKSSDWKSFYEISTEITGSNLTDSDSQQYSLCDCFRPTPFESRTTYENRFVKRKTSYGEVNLVYLQNFQDLVRMNKDYPPFSSFWSDHRCKPGECSDSNRTNAFIGDTNSTLWLLPHLNATHVFVSQGWGPWPFAQTVDMSCSIKNFESHHPSISTYLISHPLLRSAITDSAISFDGNNLECEVKSLDRATMCKDVPKEWYWDNLHLLSIMNQEFNHKLIETICPIASQS
ncbi:hypothetical protein HJC23_000420 [Cyclotella cryptica]|uniref:Uncharacterized protein n=1 Tax=Cyclotella cryptica TaxID=29204 RepID=A0ABD3PJN4_9STRA